MGSASALADEEGRKLFLGGLSYDAREDDPHLPEFYRRQFKHGFSGELCTGLDKLGG